MPTTARKYFEGLRLRTTGHILTDLATFGSFTNHDWTASSPNQAHARRSINDIEATDILTTMLQTIGIIVTNLYIRYDKFHRLASLTSTNGVYTLYNWAWTQKADSVMTFKTKDEALSWFFFDFYKEYGGCNAYTQFSNIIVESRSTLYSAALEALDLEKPVFKKSESGNTFIELHPSAAEWFLSKVNNKNLEPRYRELFKEIAGGKEDSYEEIPIIGFDERMKYFGYLAHTYSWRDIAELYVEKFERKDREAKIKDLLYAGIEMHGCVYLETSKRVVFDPFVLEVLRNESYNHGTEDECEPGDCYEWMQFRLKEKEDAGSIGKKFFLENTLMTHRRF